MTSPFRLTRSFAALLSAGALMIPLLASCGGGGGSGPKTPGIDNTSGTDSGTSTSCGRTFTPNYASSVSLLHWARFPLTVFFQQDAQLSSARQSIAIAGFNEWVTATGGRADYKVVTQASGADITVSFYKFTGGAGDTLGTTTVSYDGNNVIRSAKMELGITGNQNDDILTAAHEYGHALGITGHSPSSADIMYYTGNDTGKITASDLNTVRTAYCDNFNHSTARTSSAVGPLKTIVMH